MIKAPVSKGKPKIHAKESDRLSYPQRNIFGIPRVKMGSKSELDVGPKEAVQRERWHFVEMVWQQLRAAVFDIVGSTCSMVCLTGDLVAKSVWTIVRSRLWRGQRR